ncbi:TonB-dependent receptor [Paremcibacter congregatus]|uniref:TonB-dependent receptor n=1 Tax=Paremcibacter congregatus TaxID=2043170 RepID=UPI0030EED12E|tara:strand:- start:853 stop:2955 length:2103 start_codon:yes stop_codon:yes gene_type:complete
MSLTLLTLAAAAAALPAAPLPHTALEEIIVTGSRTAERIDEVPASVSVVGKDALLEDLQLNPEIQNTLALRVPGFGPASGSTSNSGLTLRGRRVLVMIDGVPQSTPLRNGQLGVRSVDSSALERIEIIKGATSIYGNGAAGGIVNYITKQASDEEISGDISVSSRFSLVDAKDSFSKRFDGTLSGTIDKFSYVINAVYDSRGQQKDADGDTLGLIYGLSDLDTVNLFTKAAYQIDENKRLQATFNYYDSQQESSLVDVTGSPLLGQKTYAVESGASDSRFAPQGPKGNTNIMLNYSDQELFTNTSFTLDAYRQRLKNVFFFSTSLANPEQGFDGGQSLIKSSKSGIRANFNTTVQWDKFETSFIYGIDYLKDTTSQPLLDGRIWVPEIDMNNKAAYLQTKFVWNDALVFKAGVRAEKIDITVDDYSTLLLCRSATTCSVPMDVTGGDLSYDSTTFNAGLRYKASPLFSPFISYSEGFDISDLGRLLRGAQVTDIAQVRTEASNVRHYEIGFTSEFDGLKIEFAYYQSTSELGTGTKYDPVTGVFLPVREPQKIHGFEISGQYFVTEELEVGASFTRFDGENTETDEKLTGRYISPSNLVIYADYRPTEDISLALDYQRVGDRDEFTATGNDYAIYEGPVRGYDLVNLRASYTVGAVQFYGGIENLFNKNYYSAKSQSIFLASYFVKGIGRTASLGMRYQF